MARTPLPKSAFLNPHFNAAIQEFGTALKKTSLIKHSGNKGSSREEQLREFFRERLPANYAVAEGEVVDCCGRTSPQLDLMFYNQSIDFALVSGKTQILAAESLLCSVEVKSQLTMEEIKKSAKAAQKLRELEPYGRPLGGPNIANCNIKKSARYFHCIFAYGTDLAETEWLNKESTRLFRAFNNHHLIDVVYVLNRGLINVESKIAMQENEEGSAITNFYFSILNFMQREGGRRNPTPYDHYVKQQKQKWIKLSPHV